MAHCVITFRQKSILVPNFDFGHLRALTKFDRVLKARRHFSEDRVDTVEMWLWLMDYEEL